MRLRKSALLCAVTAGLVAGLVACGRSGIDLDSAQGESVIEITITNRTRDALIHTETIYASVLQPDDDLILLFTRDGVVRDQCLRMDQVPTGRGELPVGATLVLEASVEQLSSLYCLDQDAAYEMRVARIRRDGDGYIVTETSRAVPFRASGGWRGQRNTGFRISGDGLRLDPEPGHFSSK